MSAACLATHRQKYSIELFEGSAQSGGRCRSYYDKNLDMEIDNGNHLILSANTNFLKFCKLIDSEKTLKCLDSSFNFFNLKNKSKWSLKIEGNLFPFWVFNKKQRIPNTRILDYLSILKIIFCSDSEVVSKYTKFNNLYTYFWEPLTLGILNTHCKDASALLLKNVLKETFLKGKKSSMIYQPRVSWNRTIIEPATTFLLKRKVKLNYNSLLKKIIFKSDGMSKLIFQNKEIDINSSDKVVLAMPPHNVQKILPEIKLPTEFNTILNVHFKYDIKKLDHLSTPILGLLNSITHWIFIKNNYISVTVSAANDFNDEKQESLVKKIWHEVKTALGIKSKMMPIYRLLREKKATYNQSPHNLNLIRNISNLPKNLSIIGDWTETNFPCTIESSILSGKKYVNSLD